jgi:hypothetical protein
MTVFDHYYGPIAWVIQLSCAIMLRTVLVLSTQTSYIICFDVPDGPPCNRDLYVHLYDAMQCDVHNHWICIETTQESWSAKLADWLTLSSSRTDYVTKKLQDGKCAAWTHHTCRTRWPVHRICNNIIRVHATLNLLYCSVLGSAHLWPTRVPPRCFVAQSGKQHKRERNNQYIR